MTPLTQNATLKDVQNYVREMEHERGFDNQNVTDKAILLGEEIGELFKAIRKAEGLRTDKNSDTFTVAEELADILIYLCAIANRYNINLEDAFRAKEEINNHRIWSEPQKACDVAEIREKHANAYAPWTDEMDDMLRDNFYKGKSVKELVHLLGRNTGAIQSRIKRLDLER